MITFLHTYHPSPILFSIGSFSIHWYGLLIALGAGIGLTIAVRFAKFYGIDRDFFYNYAFWLVVIGLFFDRLYYVFYNWQYYSQNISDIPKIWQGGLAIHGAIIGGLLVTIYFARKYKVNGWILLDLACVALITGLALGRFGNYFNQELFGLPTNLPWGIPIDPANRPTQFASFEYFHPTFIYESIGDLLLLLILIKGHLNRIRLPFVRAGNIFLVMLGGYGFIRMLTESLRTDFSPYLFGQRWGFWVSIFLILISIAIWGWKKVFGKDFVHLNHIST